MNPTPALSSLQNSNPLLAILWAGITCGTLDITAALEGNKLGFAIVQKGGVELMYQSYAGADKDAPAATAQAVRKGPAFLYVEVENLDETIGALKGVE
jgi:hypothetical protein